LKRPVQAAAVPLETWEQNARSSGMDEYSLAALKQMFRYYAQHGLVGNPSVLKFVLRRQPTSLDEFVEKTLRER